MERGNNSRWEYKKSRRELRDPNAFSVELEASWALGGWCEADYLTWWSGTFRALICYLITRQGHNHLTIERSCNQTEGRASGWSMTQPEYLAGITVSLDVWDSDWHGTYLRINMCHWYSHPERWVCADNQHQTLKSSITFKRVIPV